MKRYRDPFGTRTELMEEALPAIGRHEEIHAATGAVPMELPQLPVDGGKVLGITAVGRGVSELIGEATLALEMGAFLEDVGLTIHPHPTISEALQEAVEAALGRGVHTLRG